MSTTQPFYPLTNEHLLDVNSLLSDAHLRVYMYWKTLDPFENRIIPISTKAIADALGLVTRTVQIALNKLASLKILKWDKSHGLVSKFDDRHGDQGIAMAIKGSPPRSYDRQRQLELNLEASSGTPKIIKIIKIKDQLDQEEILFNFQDTENTEIAIDAEPEISIEDAIAEIQKAMGDVESLDEDLLLNNEADELQELEEILEPKPVLQLSTVGNANVTSDGKSARAAVEDFVLKTLNKTFPSAARRAAYFAKFDAKSWKKWETDCKASLVLQAPYQPYIPEKVEVASPDSLEVKSAIAFIKSKLGIKAS
jgi:hypothetical protein